jgi:pimeloyl-ACP methyl ester carboxylesterase
MPGSGAARMRRAWKIVLGILAVLIVLLILNAITVSNQTKDAERNVEGAELVSTSNGTLQVLEEGDPAGSPIVLINCFTCSMHWYEELAPLLSQGHRVIRVELLGHGGSDKPASGYSIEDQANAIAEALAELEVSDATAVGHSLGGTVATALAERSPALASRVVIIDQAPNDDFESSPFVEDLSRVPVIGQAMKRITDVAPSSMVRDQYDRAFAPGYNVASGFEDPDQVVEDLNEMTYTSYIEAAEAEGDYTDARPLDERLSASQLPVMVIFGAEDQTYDADEAIAVYEEGVPGARIELIEGAGHSPNVETPEEIAPLILEFADAAPAVEPKPAEKPAKKNGKSGKKGAGKGDKKADKGGGKSAGEKKAP